MARAPAADRRLRTARFALDLPGFGEAGPEPGPQSPWEDVLQTLQLLTGGPAALVGNSYGGAIALRIAAIAPSAVSRDGVDLRPRSRRRREPSDDSRRSGRPRRPRSKTATSSGAVAVIVDGWTLPGAPMACASGSRRCSAARSCSRRPTPGAELAPDPLEDRLDSLADVQIPALCAAGTRDLPDFVEGAVQLAETLPQGRHATIPRAGHLAPLEQPRVFRRQVLGFLDEVEGR